jgi:hypothetical protein
MRSILIFLISLVFIFLGLEAGLRIKNLKVSDDSLVKYEDKSDPDAQFQILFLGGPITMAQELAYENTYPYLIEKMLNEDSSGSFSVLHTSLVNYTTKKAIEVFLSEFSDLKPDLIILSYFLNDAEALEAPTNNWILEHSQLAVLIWPKIKQLIYPRESKSLEEHYARIYQDDYPAFIELKEAFERLRTYKEETGTQILITMIPNLPVLDGYSLDFVHEKIKRLSEENNFDFLDFKDVLVEGVDQKNDQSLMAEGLYNKVLDVILSSLS